LLLDYVSASSELSEKSDLVIGNELGCRYVWRSIPVYEIVTVARPVHRFPYFLVQ
jgi:hypothetical protein